MRNLFYVLLIPLVVSCFPGAAQNYAVYNSYYINPYLYNPAEAASEYTYIFVNHRQQWMGIEGSPVLTTVNFNTLLDNTHSGVGVKLSSFKRGLLNTTDVTLTYAYAVNFNESNSLYFGLSGGAITNNIDVSQADPNDPAVSDYLANNIQPAGNFGMVYKSATGINLGVALPQLFTPAFNNPSSFEFAPASPLDNVIVSAYYKKRLQGKIVNRRTKGVTKKVKTNDSYAPLEVHVLYKYAKSGNSQAEGMVKLNLSEYLWLGAGYRQSYGMTGALGLSIKKFLFGYSYEPGNQPEPAFSQGTHEIQLGLKLGEPKKARRPAPVLRSTLRPQTEKHGARFKQEIPPLNHTIVSAAPPEARYYVVLKVFSDFTSADRYKKEMRSQKFNAHIFYYEKDRKYYVHIFETGKSAEAFEEVRNLKTYAKMKEARVLTVEPKK